MCLLSIIEHQTELEANLAQRKIARQFRQRSSEQGVSTEWRRRRAACDAVFGAR